MTDPFDIPERELPDTVRAAARERLLRGLDSDAHRRRRRAPLAIAAAVVLLVAGAITMTQLVHGGQSPAANPEPIPNGCSPSDLDAVFEQTGSSTDQFDGAVVVSASNLNVRCAFDGDFRHYTFTMVGNVADRFPTVVRPSGTAQMPKALTITDGQVVRLGIHWRKPHDGDDSEQVADPTGLRITLPGGGTIETPWKVGTRYAGGVFQRTLTVDGFQGAPAQ